MKLLQKDKKMKIYHVVCWCPLGCSSVWKSVGINIQLSKTSMIRYMYGTKEIDCTSQYSLVLTNLVKRRYVPV